jgi:hypothetical protein
MEMRKDGGERMVTLRTGLTEPCEFTRIRTDSNVSTRK